MLSQPHVPGRTQTLTSGSVLYTPGVSLPVVMRVLEGTVKLLAHLENGDSRIVRIKRRGDWLGLQALANGAVPHTAVAVGEVLIERWPAERLRGLIDGDRQLLDQLLRQWQDEVAEADRWLTEFSTGAVPARIARLINYLTEFAPFADEDMIQLLTVHEIGEIVSARPETVSRVLAAMKREAVLQRQRTGETGTYRVDRERLRSLLEG